MKQLAHAVPLRCDWAHAVPLRCDWAHAVPCGSLGLTPSRVGHWGSRRPVWVIGAHAVPCGSLGLTPSRVVGLRPRLVAPLGRFAPSGAVAASGGLPPGRSARPPAPRSSSARPPGVRLPRPCPVLGAPSGARFGRLLSPPPSLCVGGLGGRGVPPLFPRPEAPPFSPAFLRRAALLCLVAVSSSGEGARPSPSL